MLKVYDTEISRRRHLRRGGPGHSPAAFLATASFGRSKEAVKISIV